MDLSLGHYITLWCHWLVAECSSQISLIPYRYNKRHSQERGSFPAGKGPAINFIGRQSRSFEHISSYWTWESVKKWMNEDLSDLFRVCNYSANIKFISWNTLAKKNQRVSKMVNTTPYSYSLEFWRFIIQKTTVNIKIWLLLCNCTHCTLQEFSSLQWEI